MGVQGCNSGNEPEHGVTLRVPSRRGDLPAIVCVGRRVGGPLLEIRFHGFGFRKYCACGLRCKCTAVTVEAAPGRGGFWFASG